MSKQCSDMMWNYKDEFKMTIIVSLVFEMGAIEVSFNRICIHIDRDWKILLLLLNLLKKNHNGYAKINP